MNNNIVIVLTACVNPNGMSYTVLQDSNVRRLQYIKSLHFYLNKTLLPIVFVENSNEDLSKDFKKWIDEGRLECITFDGNSHFDKIRGKGYGEAIMLLYAMEHSVILQRCRYLIKITGRLQVTNINKIVASSCLFLDNVWRSNIEKNSVTTTVFIVSPKMLKLLLERHKEEITEEQRGSFWIENVLARALVSEVDMKLTLIPFTYPPIFDALSGTSQSKYIIKEKGINTTDNLFYGSELLKLRGDKRYIFMRCCYYIAILIRKIHGYIK